MYAIGDLVVYGSTGVCKVTDITKPAFQGTSPDQLYYSLTPCYQNGVIYTPVDTKVFMRDVISGKEIDALFEELKTVKPKGFYCATVQMLTAQYEQAFKDYTCSDLAKMILSIRAKKEELEHQNRKLGQIDLRFLKKAEELLFGELAAVLGTTREEAAACLAERTGWPVSET